MAILALSGYAKSGKNTVATIMQYLQCKEPHVSLEEVLNNYEMHEWWLYEFSNWEQQSFAGKLKEIASLLTGIDVKKFNNQDFKLTNLGPEWSDHGMPMTVREFLQKLGTNALRDGLHPNTWVNALMSHYTSKKAKWSIGPRVGCENGDINNWIITDCRFLNEAKSIKDKEGKIIRVNRKGTTCINDHISERAMDGYKYDYVINNDSDLISLTIQVKNILQKENILK